MRRQTGISTAEQLETSSSGGGPVSVTNDGTFATPANQVLEIADLDAIKASTASIDTKTPSSPATSAKQDTGNTALASIATSVGDIDTATGTQADAAWVSGNGTIIAILKAIVGGGGGGGGAVTIADGADVTQGAVADAAYTSGSGTVVSILKGVFTKLASILTALGSPFQAGDSIGNIDFPVADGSNAVLGITTGAAVTTDVSSTIQRYIRGIIKFATLDGLNTPVANDWAVHHVPAVNTKATITQASAGTGNRNTCNGFTVTLTSDTTAPTVIAPIIASLIDGASGGTTYLWRSYMAIPGSAGAQTTIVKTFTKPIKGSQATAMTLEFSAAGGADTYESVSMNGSSITE